MSTDLTIRIGQHRNIAGIKHTDHDVGRIAREAKATFKSTSKPGSVRRIG
jgi:dihydrodipicolinate synthase/N-acetylneuraminate lyase